MAFTLASQAHNVPIAPRTRARGTKVMKLTRLTSRGGCTPWRPAFQARPLFVVGCSTSRNEAHGFFLSHSLASAACRNRDVNGPHQCSDCPASASSCARKLRLESFLRPKAGLNTLVPWHACRQRSALAHLIGTSPSPASTSYTGLPQPGGSSLLILVASGPP